MKSNNELLNKVMTSLHKVKDPEIDSISIVELGMVEKVDTNSNSVMIKLLPTFMGCPALDIIRKNIIQEVSQLLIFETIQVEFIYDPPWTSERITEKGRENLKQFGIAPPPEHVSETGEWHVNCPYCDSTYTTLENIFGPTACRSILYCRTCKNPFEAMKPISTLM